MAFSGDFLSQLQADIRSVAETLPVSAERDILESASEYISERADNAYAAQAEARLPA